MSLIGSGAIVSDGSGLPRLVEGLEVEDVDAPVEHSADTGLEVGPGVGGAGDSGAVI